MNIAVPSLETRKSEAVNRFRILGVPHRRVEEWKYTDLRSVLDDGAIATAGSAKWAITEPPKTLDVFDLARPNWPDWVANTLGTISKHGVMESAALGFANAGVALRVKRNTKIDMPVNLEFNAKGHGRVLIVLEDGAELTLVESHSGGDGLRNIGMEVSLGANAQLHHVRMAVAAPVQVQVETIAASLARDARYRAHFINLGAKLGRVEASIVLSGEGADATLNGVSILADSTHADVTTHVDHAVANTTSTQLFKNLVTDHGRAVYQGKVTVREGAQKSDSSQTAKALLLGERAEADLKPELEIFADDVKCAHGAAVGDLDAESLFYLRSRGIPEPQARALLMHGFVEDAVADIARDDVRAVVWQALEYALARVSGGA